jgi:GMP synthase-like glutamine amidotransferase
VRVLSIFHHDDTGPGVFADSIAARGHELEHWNITEGSPAPRPPASYGAVLISGGSMNVGQEDEFPWLREEYRVIRELLQERVPTFGICLGSQLLAHAAGAAVGPAAESEIGWYDVELTPAAREDPVFATTPDRFLALQWHSYCSALPTGAVALARNQVCLQAYRIEDFAWGIQFHAEVTKESLLFWISLYERDANGADDSFDPGAAREELEVHIAGWNDFGRELSSRFLAVAEARA